MAAAQQSLNTIGTKPLFSLLLNTVRSGNGPNLTNQRASELKRNTHSISLDNFYEISSPGFAMRVTPI